MAKPIIPGAGETVELLSETLKQRILERIAEVESARSKVSKGVARGSLKVTDRKTYDAIGQLSKELKSLNRGLGGLLATDPDAVVNPKTGATWGSLMRDILDKDITGRQLASKLESFQSFVYTGNTFKGKVGHHRTALNTLRDVLKNKPFDYRTAFKNIAAQEGYQIGEEFIDFIDPSAHMAFVKNVKGALKERLGIGTKGEIPKELADALAERFAHAKQFGGTGGYEVPGNFLKEDVDPEKLFAFAKDYLEAAKRGADAGVELSDIVTKGKYDTAEELTALIKNTSVGNTKDLVDVFGNPLKSKGIIKANKGLRIRSGLSDVISQSDVDKYGTQWNWNMFSNNAGSAVGALTKPSIKNIALDAAEEFTPWKRPVGSAIGTGIEFLTNEKLRTAVREGDFGTFATQLGKGAVQGAATEIAGRGAWSMVPTAVKAKGASLIKGGLTLASKAAPYAAVLSLGGSTPQNRRGVSLGYESEEAYLAKMKEAGIDDPYKQTSKPLLNQLIGNVLNKSKSNTEY